MVQDIAAALAARKYPYPVLYGPERVQRHGYAQAIVFERDRTQNDTIGAPNGRQQNPQKQYTRGLACVATVYAASSLAGAHVGDHERECEAVVDGVVTALNDWVTEARSGVDFVGGTYLDAKTRDGVEQWPGVAYELRFRILRGVFRRDYDGAAQPTGTVAGVARTTLVSYTGREGDPAATGCG